MCNRSYAVLASKKYCLPTSPHHLTAISALEMSNSVLRTSQNLCVILCLLPTSWTPFNNFEAGSNHLNIVRPLIRDSASISANIHTSFSLRPTEFSFISPDNAQGDATTIFSHSISNNTSATLGCRVDMGRGGLASPISVLKASRNWRADRQDGKALKTEST